MTDARRILFVTWEGGGNQWPALAIARSLMQRGHSVRIAAYDSQQHRLATMGFEVSLLRHGGTKPTGTDPLQAVYEGVFANPSHLADVAEQATEFNPDLLVVDCLLFGALAGAEAAGSPTVAFVHSAPRALAESPGISALVPRLNALRAQAGLDRISSVADAWAPNSTLVTSLEELDGDVPSPGFTFVGPIADTRAGAYSSPWERSDERPLVLVSLSTGRVFGDQTTRYQRIADALTALPVRVLITTGDAVDPEALSLAENARGVRFAPHPAILEHASACITHAGHGTVCASLRAGVPLLCLPNPAADQPFLAARIAALGAGHNVGRNAPASEIRDAFNTLMDDPAYRARAGDLSASIRRSTGVAGAVAMLEGRPRTGPAA